MSPLYTQVFAVPLRPACSTGGDQTCSSNDGLQGTAAVTLDAHQPCTESGATGLGSRVTFCPTVVSSAASGGV